MDMKKMVSKFKEHEANILEIVNSMSENVSDDGQSIIESELEQIYDIVHEAQQELIDLRKRFDALILKKSEGGEEDEW